MSSNDPLDQLRLDSSELVIEQTITDRRVGSIRKLIPIKTDGEPDPARSIRFIGQSQIMTPAGPLPISFELQGSDLASAIDQFPHAAHRAIEEAVEELKKMQRDQQSSIMVPGQKGGQGGMGPTGGFQL
jgi:hypothetical protein